MNIKKGSFSEQVIKIFLLTFFIMFIVNIFILNNMKSVLDNVDLTYEGNRKLMEMRDSLDSIHLGMQEYLNTKDENTLNKFYSDEDKFKDLIKNLKHDSVKTELQIKENGLYNLSEEYIQSVNQTVIAKKGKNIEKYQEYQNKANSEYEYTTSYMTNLNNLMFLNNSSSYKRMLELTKYTEVLYSIIIMLSGFLDICILVLSIRKLTDPLKKLAETAEEVGNGNLDIVLVESNAVNEIGTVNRAFNQMVVSLKDYIDRFRQSLQKESALKEKSIRMESSVREAELKYLQAQIDPHFLFNTLNAGAQLAMMEGADKTYNYIHKVADFFRTKIKKDSYFSTIYEELNIVDDYIYILNGRYSGEIIYTANVEEGLGNISIPSMIFQPIVENSIKHGLSEVDWEKHIDISVYEEDDNVVVSIRDNGVGMSQDIINKIMAGESVHEYEHKKGEGIGMDNVIERLRNFYNTDNVVEITSVGPNMGVEVALFIPKNSKEIN